MLPSERKHALILWIPLLTAVLSLLLFWLALAHGWFGQALPGVGEYGEREHAGLVKEPCNTWSSLGFIISGLAIAWLLLKGKYKHRVNRFTGSRFYPAFFASVVVLLGTCSMARHASNAPLGIFFDMVSMYLLASFVVAYAAQGFFRLKLPQFLLVYGVALAGCFVANFLHWKIVFRFFGITTFAFYILLGAVLESLNLYVRRLKRDGHYVFLSLGTLLVSLVIWVLSRTGGLLCYPDSLIQGHAIWHLLDALAAFFLFRYYVSERRATAPVPRPSTNPSPSQGSRRHEEPLTESPSIPCANP